MHRIICFSPQHKRRLRTRTPACRHSLAGGRDHGRGRYEILDSEATRRSRWKSTRSRAPSERRTFGRRRASASVSSRQRQEPLPGKGCLQAVKNVNDVLGPAVIGKDCRNSEIDQLMIDLMERRTSKARRERHLGVSLAVKAGAAAKAYPCINMWQTSLVTHWQTCSRPAFNVSTAAPHAKTNWPSRSIL